MPPPTADSQARGESPLGGRKNRDIMERLIETIRDFVRKEDPLLWLSFFIASVISLLFFLFIIIYVNILKPV